MISHDFNWQAARDYERLFKDFNSQLQILLANKPCAPCSEGNMLGAKLGYSYYLYVTVILGVLLIGYIFATWFSVAISWIFFLLLMALFIKGKDFWGASWSIFGNNLTVRTMGKNRIVTIDSISSIEIHLNRSTFELILHSKEGVIKLYDPFIDKIHLLYCSIINVREDLSIRA